MYNLIGTAKKFWGLEGFVAIIFSIFAFRALMYGHILGAILMGIFAYWWVSRVLSKPMKYRSSSTNYHSKRDLDI